MLNTQVVLVAPLDEAMTMLSATTAVKEPKESSWPETTVWKVEPLSKGSLPLVPGSLNWAVKEPLT
jgi:hypothetical protein